VRTAGWSYQNLTVGLDDHAVVTDALMMAIWRRGQPDALLHHSDRGSQCGLKRLLQQP
jgi:putative transposase